MIVNRTIATIPVGNSPSNVAITPNNHFAYVANDNNAGIVGADTVSVIDIQTNKVITTISDASFNQVYSITIDAKGLKAYVTNSNTTTVSVINIATNTVIDVITGFDGPCAFAITPDGLYAYVPNYGCPAGVGSGNGTTVNRVDLVTNTIVGPAITVDQAPASLAMTPDGTSVYVINYVTGNPGTGTVNIINTTSNLRVGSIPGFFGPYAIAITPNGKYAYVSNFGSNNFAPMGTTVSVIDLDSNTITATVTVGIQPAGLAVTPNGCFVYVLNYNTQYLGAGYTDLTPGVGTVRIINVATNALLPPVMTTSASPAGITISPDGKRAYVANYSSNNVTVLDINDRMWLDQVC